MIFHVPAALKTCISSPVHCPLWIWGAASHIGLFLTLLHPSKLSQLYHNLSEKWGLVLEGAQRVWGGIRKFGVQEEMGGMSVFWGQESICDAPKGDGK